VHRAIRSVVIIGFISTTWLTLDVKSAEAQQLRVENAYPRQLPIGQTTIVNAVLANPNDVKAAEVSPSQGVTVTRGTTPGTPEPASAAASSAASSGPATLGADQADEFKRRWREVQGDFVDDPQLAVRGAEALAREILDALATRIADKQRVDAWQAGAGAPTEDLRLALRAYRTLVDRLIEL